MLPFRGNFLIAEVDGGLYTYSLKLTDSVTIGGVYNETGINPLPQGTKVLFDETNWRIAAVLKIEMPTTAEFCGPRPSYYPGLPEHPAFSASYRKNALLICTSDKQWCIPAACFPSETAFKTQDPNEIIDLGLPTIGIFNPYYLYSYEHYIYDTFNVLDGEWSDNSMTPYEIEILILVTKAAKFYNIGSYGYYRLFTVAAVDGHVHIDEYSVRFNRYCAWGTKWRSYRVDPYIQKDNSGSYFINVQFRSRLYCKTSYWYGSWYYDVSTRDLELPPPDPSLWPPTITISSASDNFSYGYTYFYRHAYWIWSIFLDYPHIQVYPYSDTASSANFKELAVAGTNQPFDMVCYGQLTQLTDTTTNTTTLYIDDIYP